jgi:nitroimidazol reductase NimA-like FMN-containing flavoprotein (pyridoxamine 5'-phosphate oxidase superfamily)
VLDLGGKTLNTSSCIFILTDPAVRGTPQMAKADDIRQEIKTLCSSQKLAVLCTQRENQPYASLVAFVISNDLKYLYLITPKTTRKFTNLAANPQVSVLINSSENQESDFHRAMAVTIVGSAAEISGHERAALIDVYLEKHPYLEDFAKSPTCALVQITVKSYFLVKNFQNVMELHLHK